MAQRTQIIVIDDLTGETLPDGQGQTVTFALDGTSYELDLNKDNADKLRDDLKRFVQAARKVTRRSADSKGRPASRSHKDTAAIRAWAQENGHSVAGRGRIPSPVIEAYEAAN